MSTGRPAGFRTFLVVWFGQTVSTLGTGLTQFGISVWVFLETGSIAALAAISVAAVLPRALLMPFAGVFIDRWNRRTALLLSDAGSGVATMLLAALFAFNATSLPLLAVAVVMSSAFSALQWPAYQAATTLLVPKEQFSRAQGLIQLSDAAASLIPPALAALVLSFASVTALIAIDILTFLIAVATLLRVTFPDPPASQVGTEAAGSSVLRDAGLGFRYIAQRRGLAGLLTYQFLLSLVSGFVVLLLTGYILSVASEQALGTVSSIGAAGFLAGAAVMSAWRGARDRRVLLIVLATVGSGAAIALVGGVTSLAAIACLLFLSRLIFAAEHATYRALWQAKVEPDVQGRVFAARAMVVTLGMPIAFVLADPLMSGVFVPLLEAESGFGDALRSMFGTDVGAPYRAFFTTGGLLFIVTAILGWSYGPLRRVEREIPDFS